MNFKLLTILSLSVLTSFGQDIDKAIQQLDQLKHYQDSAIDQMKLSLKPVPVDRYVQFPDLPRLTDPVTITTTATGFNLDNKKLSGKTEVILTAGTTHNISNTWSVGTKENPVKFVGSRTRIHNAISSGKYCFNGVTYPRHVEVYRVDMSGNHGALRWVGDAGSNPSSCYVEDVTMTGHNFAGYWVNDASRSYSKINSSFLRVSKTLGEGLYIGSTTKSALSKIDQSHHSHLYVDSTAWDGVQITSAADVLIRNATVRRTGLADKDGHQRLLQMHACEGLVEYSIFDNWGSPGSGMEFFSEGLTVRNSFIGYQGNDQIYCGEWAYATLSNKPLVFDSVVFYVDGEGPLFNNAAKSYQVIVKNSVIPSNRNLSGVVDGGGNVFLPLSKISRPEYVIERDSPAGTVPAWLITGFYNTLGYGYRSVRP